MGHHPKYVPEHMMKPEAHHPKEPMKPMMDHMEMKEEEMPMMEDMKSKVR